MKGYIKQKEGTQEITESTYPFRKKKIIQIIVLTFIFIRRKIEQET